MEQWPALFTERQVFAEFNRVVPTDLQSNFYGAVDRYTPRFVTVFKSSRSIGEKLDELMQQMNTGVCDVDEAWAQLSVGVLTVIDEKQLPSLNKLYLCPVSTAIIVEKGIVMDNLQNLPQAICIYFGPKDMKNTFNFIQKLMLALRQNKLSPKLQSLVE